MAIATRESALIFVAGASPQVITETVWALAQRPGPRTRMEVLTTTKGREIIVRELFARDGMWPQLRRDWPVTRRFAFEDAQVIVIPGSGGEPLEDVRSESDNLETRNEVTGTRRSKENETEDNQPS